MQGMSAIHLHWKGVLQKKVLCVRHICHQLWLYFSPSPNYTGQRQTSLFPTQLDCYVCHSERKKTQGISVRFWPKYLSKILDWKVMVKFSKGQSTFWEALVALGYGHECLLLQLCSGVILYLLLPSLQQELARLSQWWPLKALVKREPGMHLHGLNPPSDISQSNSSGQSPLIWVPTTAVGKEPKFMSEEMQVLVPTTARKYIKATTLAI